MNTSWNVLVPMKISCEVLLLLLLVLLVVLLSVWLLDQVLAVLEVERSGKCLVLCCVLMSLAMTLGK